MTFGEKLQLLRKQNGMSQEQLALKLDVSRQAISKWELNNSLPDTENAIQLSQLFCVSLDYLLKDDELIMNHDEKSSLDQNFYNNVNSIANFNVQNDLTAKYDSNATTDLCNHSDKNETLKTTLTPQKTKSIYICGIVGLFISSIGLFVVWLLSKLYPAPIVFYNSTTKTWKVGLENFIWVHGLETFMLFMNALFIISLLLIFHKQLKKIAISVTQKIRRTNK